MAPLVPAYKMGFVTFLDRNGRGYRSTYAFNTLKEAKSYMKYEKDHNKNLVCFAVKKKFSDGQIYGVYERTKVVKSK